MLIIALCALSVTVTAGRVWLTRPLTATDLRLAAVEADLNA